MTKRLPVTASIAFCSCLAITVSPAQETDQHGADWLTDRFSVSLGVFLPDTTTKLRADSPDGTLGTTIGYEDELDMSGSDTSIDVGLLWRITRKHRLEFEYFDIRRDGMKNLDVDFNFNGELFQGQFETDSFMKTRVIRAGYGYSFINDADREFGLHLGIHVTDVRTGIAAINGGGGSGLSEKVGTTAPLPVVGAHGSYRFGNRWVLYGRAQYFQLEINDFDGDMIQYAIGLEHDTFRKVSLGLAYKSFEIDVDITKDDWLGNIDLHYYGPTLYIRGGFGTMN